MKKNILILAVSFFFTLNAYSQTWVDMGLKLGGGTSWLINSGIFNDNTYTHKFSGAFNVGLKLSMNFREKSGVAVEALYSSNRQNFDYRWLEDGGAVVEGVNEIQWSNIDLYLLYRFYANSAFTEIGVMNSFVQSVKQMDVGAGYTDATDIVEPFYESSYLSAVFGGGALVAGEESFTVMMGMRFHYALTDFISDDGRDETILENNNLSYAFPNPFHQDFSGKDSNPYESYKKTSPLFVELIMELNFGLGAFAKTVCGGRSKWIGGKY